MIAPYDWQLLQVFQSTLPRGERLLMFCLIVPLLNFNPRSHEGSDILPVPPPAAVSISIHAPTRGATVIYSHKKESRRFQSTLPRGERQRRFLKFPSEQGFQSTLPRGERQSYIPTKKRVDDFNPRSHEGSDAGVATSVSSAVDFNPRSHEGSDHRLIGA